MNLLLRRPENDREHRDVGTVAEAGELPQRVLRVGGSARQLADHEVDDVVGVPLGVDALEIPGPARLLVIEGQQPLVGERVKKLDREKRIAAGLLVHQLRQRRGLLRVACSASATSRAEVVDGRAAPSVISCTVAPACRIASSLRMSGCAGVTSLSR